MAFLGMAMFSQVASDSLDEKTFWDRVLLPGFSLNPPAPVVPPRPVPIMDPTPRPVNRSMRTDRAPRFPRMNASVGVRMDAARLRILPANG
jgi:hypothetical protein